MIQNSCTSARWEATPLCTERFAQGPCAQLPLAAAQDLLRPTDPGEHTRGTHLRNIRCWWSHVKPAVPRGPRAWLNISKSLSEWIRRYWAPVPYPPIGTPLELEEVFAPFSDTLVGLLWLHELGQAEFWCKLVAAQKIQLTRHPNISSSGPFQLRPQRQLSSCAS